MKRISGIYKITNIINNKSYIGSSVDIQDGGNINVEANVNQNGQKMCMSHLYIGLLEKMV